MSQNYTKEEMREMFMGSAKHLALYWSKVENESDYEKIMGFLHSMLCIIDGVSGGFPASIDLVLRPHPEDKQFNIDNGDNWVEDGMCINDDIMLHEALNNY